MKGNIVPDSYEAWRHCIEVDCALRLDAAYIQQRIDALEDSRDFHTQQFVRSWGEAHRQCVVAWFRQAKNELDPLPST